MLTYLGCTTRVPAFKAGLSVLQRTAAAQALRYFNLASAVLVTRQEGATAEDGAWKTKERAQEEVYFRARTLEQLTTLRQALAISIARIDSHFATVRSSAPGVDDTPDTAYESTNSDADDQTGPIVEEINKIEKDLGGLMSKLGSGEESVVERVERGGG